MTDNDSSDVGSVFGGDEPVAEATEAPAAPKKKAPAKKAAAKSSEPAVKYVRIKLAHSKDIPPSGLYIGHNGRGYLLRPGVEADVPEFLLDVLDNAVMAKPVLGTNGQVQGWEDQPRFMYSIVRKK